GRTPAGSPTSAPPTPWPSTASVSSPAPRASSPPSNPPTPPAGSPRPPGTAASPAAPWSSSTGPAAATRTSRPSPASWSTPRPYDGPAGRANGPLSTSGARVAKMPDPGTPGPAPSGAPSQPAQGVAEPDPPVSGPPVGEATPRGQAVRAAVHNPGGRSGDPAPPAVAPVERLEGRLEAMRREGRAALVAYGVAGYPDLDGSLAAFRAMAEAGADVLEVGPPYSDPLIDGPVIQRAVHAALDAGTRLDDVLGLVNELTASVDAPVVLLVYYNLVAHRGPGRFAAELAAAGACGAVVPDLPPEEAGEWLEAGKAAGIAPVFLAAPTSSDTRLAALAKAGRGF